MRIIGEVGRFGAQPGSVVLLFNWEHQCLFFIFRKQFLTFRLDFLLFFRFKVIIYIYLERAITAN